MDKNENRCFLFLNKTLCGSWTKNEHRFLLEQNFVAFVAHEQKMKIDLSFLNKTLWLMEGTSHGQK